MNIKDRYYAADSAESFRVGETCSLRSGGCQMTIEDITREGIGPHKDVPVFWVHCVWFADTVNGWTGPHRSKYPSWALKK